MALSKMTEIKKEILSNTEHITGVEFCGCFGGCERPTIYIKYCHENAKYLFHCVHVTVDKFYTNNNGDHPIEVYPDLFKAVCIAHKHLVEYSS